MNKIEILAPAGSIESLHAAINAGADAVYIGGTLFGARAYANNLDEETLLRAIDYVHVKGKQMYLTVNTLLKDEELSEHLYTYLRRFYMEGLDAVIVQDVGAMRYIHEHFPKLPIHASTQMTLTMAEGAKTFEDYGVTRMVTSRELSLEEIRRIRANTSLEIESFVHGALCYSYSGQCLMSSMIGGRSGNRGRCAQPCRMEHGCKESGSVVSKKEESFLLSPKDICTLDSVAEFIEAGIDSFKIEGRMKRYEYSAGVVESYRKQVDLYYELGSEGYRKFKEKNPNFIKEDMLKLQDLYNRGGFSNGYYQAHNGKSMMSMHRPNHSGVYVGKIVDIKGINASIRLEENINAQDILEIRENGDKVYEFTVKDGAKAGQILKSNFKPGSKVSIGNEVYRTKNNQLLEELSEKYYENERKVSIHGLLCATPGEKLELQVSTKNREDKLIKVSEIGDVVEPAMKQPMTREKIKAQLEKTNETPFTFENLDIELNGDVFIPVSKLNEIRRNALLRLEEAMAQEYKREEALEPIMKDQSKEFIAEDNNSDIGIIAFVKDEEQLIHACEIEEVDEIYLDMAECNFLQIEKLSKQVKEYKKRCYIVMPHIFRSYTYDLFLRNKAYLLADTIDGYVIKNYEQYTFFKNLQTEEHLSKEVRLDYNMYVMNNEAKKFYLEHGITHTTASVELNQGELSRLGISNMDLLVYGNLPLMVSAQCVKMNTTGCRKQVNKANKNLQSADDDKSLVLVDRLKNELSVRTNCRECYNTIYNSKCLSLLEEVAEIQNLNPRNIRLDFSNETGEEVSKVLKSFVDVFKHGIDSSLNLREYTKGHFRRGIL